jgi:hypothetical protein
VDGDCAPAGTDDEAPCWRWQDMARCKLEDFVRCSESHLWKLMMSFYDRKGVESWAQGIVPHFITCNAFIGRCVRHHPPSHHPRSQPGP